jgi:membrane protein YqaA with SNARE-associated domain
MQAFVAKLIAVGPLGVFLLAFFDSLGVPLPGGVDALLVVVANQRPDWAYWCAGLATVGSLLGSMALFLLARKGGQKYLETVTAGNRGHRFRRWFARYGLVTVFVPAISVIPMPLKAFVACAGVLGIRPQAFALTVLAARVPRYLFVAWLGREMGDKTLSWIRAHTLQFGLGLGVVALVLFLLLRLADLPSQARSAFEENQ